MKYCGNTIEAIAEQKAGIIKEGVPVVTTAEEPALSVIARKAYAMHSRLYALDHSFDVVGNAGPEDPATGQMVTVREKFGFAITTVLPLLGKHQRINCAAAVMTLLLLARHEKKLTRTALEMVSATSSGPDDFKSLRPAIQTSSSTALIIRPALRLFARPMKTSLETASGSSCFRS